MLLNTIVFAIGIIIWWEIFKVLVFE